ncbi:TIGR03617 family F420-dependent LLM class oxidoreductase [Nitriliruptoraceae bacterium ZYF776]|nr:TIGR03617 family F420-dependent LLM class oxidoreductase [Profundirhabdus halotolerans]
MLVDHFTYGLAPSAVPAEIANLEAAGVDGWFVAEADRDPTIAATLAAEHSERIAIGTGVALAFARSPMTTAYMSHGLQEIARGRFVLGLGSQIRPHIERRFAMPFTPPIARMREYITAVRSIWDAWVTGGDLDFRGEHYQHTLMPPAFRPPTDGLVCPPIYLAAVGPKMTALAGELADGIMCHPFSGARYIEEVTLPRVRDGILGAERSGSDVTVSASVLVATGPTDEAIHADIETARERIAFYASTPAYRAVLDTYGWGELHTDARRLTREGRWTELAALIDDEMLSTFVVVGAPDEVGAELARRFGGLIDRVNLSTGHRFSAEEWATLIGTLRPADPVTPPERAPRSSS